MPLKPSTLNPYRYKELSALDPLRISNHCGVMCQCSYCPHLLPFYYLCALTLEVWSQFALDSGFWTLDFKGSSR
jgi:hypothetical protein